MKADVNNIALPRFSEASLLCNTYLELKELKEIGFVLDLDDFEAKAFSFIASTYNSESADLQKKEFDKIKSRTGK